MLNTLSDSKKNYEVVSGEECGVKWNSLFLNNMREIINLSGSDIWWEGKEAGALGRNWILIGQFLSYEWRMEERLNIGTGVLVNLVATRWGGCCLMRSIYEKEEVMRLVV